MKDGQQAHTDDRKKNSGGSLAVERATWGKDAVAIRILPVCLQGAASRDRLECSTVPSHDVDGTYDSAPTGLELAKLSDQRIVK